MQVSDSSSRILAGLLEARTGQQLTMSRRWRIETALAALLRERGIPTLDELITILVMGREPSLATQVVEALLNNETYFFRDRTPFDLLTRAALPKLAQRRQRQQAAPDLVGRLLDRPGSLFAGDDVRRGPGPLGRLDDRHLGQRRQRKRGVDRARDGTYSQFEVQRGLGITQMIRWFEECDDGWRAVEPLRRLVRFQVHNLLEPAPHPGQFDIVLCRNVLLYLNAERRGLVFDRLAGAMAPDGWLMLGAGETVIGQTTQVRGRPGIARPLPPGRRRAQSAAAHRRRGLTRTP